MVTNCYQLEGVWGMEIARDADLSENNSLEAYYQQYKLNQYKENIMTISAQSAEDWYSLWENDIYPIQIKDLDLNAEEDLQLLHAWLSAFHYFRYSEIKDVNKYKELLLQAQNTFVNTDNYINIGKLLRRIIKSCSLQ
jgi:hypothetical protein